MITEVCLYLKNWFDNYQPKYRGKFKIEQGVLIPLDNRDMGILENQYYRIVGSIFNDGVHQKGSETLTDEEFTGAVWLMAVPKDFLALVSDISTWQSTYGGVGSTNMSPYASESFGGYSYSKSSGGVASGSSSSVPTWQDIFRDRLWRYKKI